MEWHKKAQEFYARITETYDFSADELVLLNATVENLHFFCEAADLLRKEGLTVGEPGKLQRKHPASEIAKAAWSQFLSGCKHLGVCRPEAEPKRPYGVL